MRTADLASAISLDYRVFGPPHTVEVARSNPAPTIGLASELYIVSARYLRATGDRPGQIGGDRRRDPVADRDCAYSGERSMRLGFEP
jgi:hypothetical protein